MGKKMLGACVGDCVHIAGVLRFLKFAEEQGYETKFLGPATSNEELVTAIREYEPDVVGVSYRLTPKQGHNVLAELRMMVREHGLDDMEFILGGLPGLVDVEKGDGFFKACFSGDETEEVIRYFRGLPLIEEGEKSYPQGIIERIDYKRPFPILRHHFGLPSLDETIEGIEKIAESRCLDVISLGTDQNCQAHFFHPDRMSSQEGAGGVPARTREDFEKLYKASRMGNFPIMRTYAGTDDLIKLAELYAETINNAWNAVPIFWFNEMDGRGPMGLEESIKAHLDAIKWHAEKNIPVEILESHHWSMRDAPDEVAVAAGYLGAEICKELGVKNFVPQYMFNTPPQTSQRDDLAKMLAQKHLISTLEDEDFKVYTQTRTGLFSYPSNLDRAKGQLAQSTMLQMQLNPDIVHVVSYSEANHAATPENVIESCDIAKQVIAKSLDGQPRMELDPYITDRSAELTERALGIVREIKQTGSITDPFVLYDAVRSRIFHAPQLDSYFSSKLKNDNRVAAGGN